MIYDWSYEDIKKDIDKINKIINNEENMYKKSLYKYILDRIEEEYSCVLVNNHLPKMGMQTYMIDLNSSYLSNRRYYELIDNLNVIINNNEKLYNDILVYYLNNKKESYSISDKKCVEVVSEVFLNLDSKFSNLYREFYKNIDKSVKFDNSDDCEDYDGFCINIGILNKNYVLIKEKKGMPKCINFAHECGHVLAYRLDPYKVYKTHDEFLEEVSSIFFELVFEYEYSYKYDSLSTSIFNFETYHSILSVNNKLLSHKRIIDEWINNDYEVTDNYYSILKDKYNLNRKDACDIIKCNIVSEGKYNIGYLVALYLLHKYKQDKNEALMLLRTILNMREKDSYIVINQLLNYDYINEEVNVMLNSVKEDMKKRLTLR